MFVSKQQSKKRKADDTASSSGDGLPPAATTTVLPPSAAAQLQQRKKLIGVSPDGKKRRRDTSDSTNLTLHQIRCLSLYQQKMESINASFAKQCADMQAKLEQNFSNNLSTGTGPPLGWEGPCERFCLASEQISDTYNAPPGDVLAFGSNDCNQVGVGTPDHPVPTSRPKLVRNLVNVPTTKVACGGIHNIAVTCHGTVYSWGCNDNGALGRECQNEVEETTPSQVTGFVPPSRGANKIVDDSSIIAVGAGSNHSLYLSLEGRVYMTGGYRIEEGTCVRDLRPSDDFTKDEPHGPEEKEDGVPKPPLGRHWFPTRVYHLDNDKVIDIACGEAFNAAIAIDPENDQQTILYTWGIAEHGEMARKVALPVKKGRKYTDLQLAQIAETLLKPQPVMWSTPTRPRVVVTVSCGDYHLLVVARGNEDNNKLVLYSSGLNNYGQLGQGHTELLQELTPVPFCKDKNIAKVSAGLHHSMVLDANGRHLYTFGRGDYGQLGITDTQPEVEFCEATPQLVSFPSETASRITKIACGGFHSMCVTDADEVYSWGFGTEGALGHGIPTVGGDEYRPRKLNVMSTFQKKKKKKTKKDGDDKTPPPDEKKDAEDNENKKKDGDDKTPPDEKKDAEDNKNEENKPEEVGIVRQVSCGGQHSVLVVTRMTE